VLVAIVTFVSGILSEECKIDMAVAMDALNMESWESTNSDE
jgi:hypothetical protein